MPTFRPYENEDLDRCAEIAVDAWPIASVIAKSEQTHSLMKAYVELSLLMSDYKDVCCERGRVAGFLFGSTRRQLPTLKDRKAYHRLLWGFISGRYGRIKQRTRFVCNFILTLVKVEFLCRRFDGEVVLFAVDGESRGLGIGRSLMDRFINYAGAANVRTVYLYTDIESNWRFYEKYGFTRYKDFYDHELSFLKKKKIISFIYYYEL